MDDDIKVEENYKKKYYSLLRELRKMVGTIDRKCPMVKSCCGACVTLRSKLKHEKNEIEWTYKND